MALLHEIRKIINLEAEIKNYIICKAKALWLKTNQRAFLLVNEKDL